MDCDGDGTTETSCDLDGDGVDDFVGGGDCDDTDANSVPTDQDGDGVTVCAGDCDDNDSSVYPGAAELLWDGVDNSCDSVVDSISSEDYTSAVTGVSEDYLSFDNSLSVGDMNGDGTNDILVGGGLLGLANEDYVGGVHMLDGSSYSSWDGTAEVTLQHSLKVTASTTTLALQQIPKLTWMVMVPSTWSLVVLTVGGTTVVRRHCCVNLLGCIFTKRFTGGF